MHAGEWFGFLQKGRSLHAPTLLCGPNQRAASGTAGTLAPQPVQHPKPNCTYICSWHCTEHKCSCCWKEITNQGQDSDMAPRLDKQTPDYSLAPDQITSTVKPSIARSISHPRRDREQDGLWLQPQPAAGRTAGQLPVKSLLRGSTVLEAGGSKPSLLLRRDMTIASPEVSRLCSQKLWFVHFVWLYLMSVKC